MKKDNELKLREKELNSKLNELKIWEDKLK